MFHKRKKNCNYKMYHGIILCIFGFICDIACTKYGRTGKISHVVIPGNREIVGDKDFSVAKKLIAKRIIVKFPQCKMKSFLPVYAQRAMKIINCCQ